MLVNEYRLKIQFKKVRNVRNINNIPMVGSRPLDFRPAQNVCAERDFTWSLICPCMLIIFTGGGEQCHGACRLGRVNMATADIVDV
jgi:hypothetical protein